VRQRSDFNSEDERSGVSALCLQSMVKQQVEQGVERMTGLVTRRTILGATAGAAALRITGASAQVPPLPKSPVTINIVDVAGNLALT
jgi:hypothetical protein